jgi:peptidyl-dipeptidase A
MMKILPISLFLFALIFCLLPGAATNQPAADEAEVVAALDDLETKLDWTAFRANSERWRAVEEPDDDSVAFFEQLAFDVAAGPAVYEALRGHRAQLNDNIDKRRFDLLYPVVVHAQVDGNRLIRGLRDSLLEFYAQPWCRWEDGPVTPEFLRTIAAGRGRSNRQLAYRRMSSPDGPVAQQMARLFRLRNQATRRLGYNDFLSLSLDLAGIETDAYLNFLDAVDSVTRVPFESLAGELRTSMGSETLEVYDWESRFAGTTIEANALFPVDSQKVYLQRFASGMGFDINRLPIYWRTLTDTVAGDKSIALVLTPGNDVRVVARLTDGVESYVSLVHAFALAMRGVLVAQDDDLLARTVEPGWSTGITGMFERLAIETAWLPSVTGAPGDLRVRLARARRATRLLRIRLLLVEARLEYEAYRNPGQDVNEQYWNLFDQYIGLPRHDDLTPWAGNKAFVTRPLAAYYELLGECAAAQNVNYLSRQYDRIVSDELGSFLTHSYFRFGARYDWKELIERATGESLSPDYLGKN